MPATKTRKTGAKPLLLSRRDEEILQTICYYRYMTALDVVHLLFAPASLTYVRARLAALAGGEDFKNHQYLYRFPLPQLSSGRTEKVYTLGNMGKDYLVRDAGIPVNWYFRPHKVRHLSQGYIAHNLTLTRFLVAARYFGKTHQDFKIVKMLTSYEIEIMKTKKVDMVIPDAWMLFEEFKGGLHKRWLPVLLEIDRGTEYKQKFMQHVKARIELITSGAYEELFGEKAVTIAYATTGQLPEYQTARRAAMCHWTLEVLEELNKKNWASIFRMCSVNRSTLYTDALFEGLHWFQPDQPAPVSLFSS